MTARATDWTLAVLVVIGFATGGLTLYSGDVREAWVFTLHGAAGVALAAALSWKLRRVLPRLRHPELRDVHTPAGLAALAVVVSALCTGIAWSTGATPSPLGFSLLAWHEALGAALLPAVAIHASARARLPTRGNPAARRDFLRLAVVAAGAFGAWKVQKPAARLIDLRGAKRRFTGSYEAASFEGNAFPSTSWVADDPRLLDAARWRLAIAGLVSAPRALTLGELAGDDEVVATLDCTGGFYSTQRWSGVRLERVLVPARPSGNASHVRVVSHTGYRWTFDMADAGELLLATHVGGEPISHEHGAPLRLVAPGRRGFEWVKWVVRVELTDRPDPGALASTVWSSFTRAGRGA
jgi:DMSO/TMAO reductase YedYZ molybdopterin-dependent catalytic subunit